MIPGAKIVPPIELTERGTFRDATGQVFHAQEVADALNTLAWSYSHIPGMLRKAPATFAEVSAEDIAEYRAWSAQRG